MLPASWLSRPEATRQWCTSAAVVDFPFEPVIATTRGARSYRSHSGSPSERKKRPTSLSTGTPSSIARATWGFGAG